MSCAIIGGVAAVIVAVLVVGIASRKQKHPKDDASKEIRRKQYFDFKAKEQRKKDQKIMVDTSLALGVGVGIAIGNAIGNVGLFIDLDHKKDSFDVGVLSPYLGLSYQVNENSMAYGSYSESFKSGGWNAYFISTEEQFDYDAEYVSSIEAGYKITMMNNRLRINTAFYASSFTDFQVYQFQQTQDSLTFITLTNAGKVSSSGFELEVSFIPFSGLTLRAVFGTNNTNYDEFKDGGGPGVDYDGNKLEYSPEKNNSLFLDYQFAIGKLGRLKFHYDKSSKLGFFTNNNNNKDTNWIDAYSMLILDQVSKQPAENGQLIISSIIWMILVIWLTPMKVS